MLHIIEKLLTKATNFFQTSPQSNVYTKVMGPQSRDSPHFENFGTPNLGVPKQNYIWM
jgi:hypothetical protein